MQQWPGPRRNVAEGHSFFYLDKVNLKSIVVLWLVLTALPAGHHGLSQEWALHGWNFQSRVSFELFQLETADAGFKTSDLAKSK